MSDPAVEAAQRAFDADLGIRRPFSVVPDGNFVKKATVDAALEALAPIRTLHEPLPFRRRACCTTCFDCGGRPVYWPCPTALLCYTTDEIKEMTLDAHRTITTREELEALPVGDTILDRYDKELARIKPDPAAPGVTNSPAQPGSREL